MRAGRMCSVTVDVVSSDVWDAGHIIYDVGRDCDKIIDALGILLIFDEIMTRIGTLPRNTLI
jgi:hypothetical protein